MYDTYEHYAAKCTKRQMTEDDLKDMLNTEQERVLRRQHATSDCVFIGVHSGALAVTFSEPPTDPTTAEEIKDGLLRARIRMREHDLCPVSVDWSGDPACAEKFQAELKFVSEGSELETREQGFCFATQARQWIEETVPAFDTYEVKTVNGCELSDTFIKGRV